MIIQLTGLSGSGKSTLADALAALPVYTSHKRRVQVIDGDEFRDHLCPDLKFSKKDRLENNRRLNFIARLLNKHGIDVVMAVISPYAESRESLRKAVCSDYVEVYVKCAISILQERDTKGLYRRAALPPNDPDYLSGLTGVSDVYDEPENPTVTVDTGEGSIQGCLDAICGAIFSKLSISVVGGE